MEFDGTLFPDGFGYDIGRIISSRFITNPKVQTLCIRWDVARTREGFPGSLYCLSRQAPFLLESLCEALNECQPSLAGLQHITLEAFDSRDPPGRVRPLLDIREEDDREDFKTLLRLIGAKLPTSEDERVECCDVEGLDSSKLEMRIPVEFHPESEDEDDDSEEFDSE